MHGVHTKEKKMTRVVWRNKNVGNCCGDVRKRLPANVPLIFLEQLLTFLLSANSKMRPLFFSVFKHPKIVRTGRTFDIRIENAVVSMKIGNYAV